MDGNPLAIELAATWVRVLSLSRICGEIERGLDLLTSRYGDAPVRQRSFRASLEHSWQLLGSGEKELLCRLTVFEGGFTLDAARSIAGAEPSSLVSLVDRSLLGVRLLPEQCERFELHALVRGYALEKCEEWPGLAAELSEFHSRYYLARLASAADDLWGSDQTVTASQLALELANIRCSWVAASSSGNVEALRRAVEALWAVAEFIGALEPGAKLLREVRLLLVVRGLSTADAAYLEAVEGWFLVRLGRFADSEALARHALQVGRAADDRLVKIAALNTLAATAGSRGDLWRCRELYLEFFELVESSGDDRYLGVAFNDLAEVEAELGLYAETECRYRQALTSARRQGNMRAVGQVLVNLAVALIWQVRSLEALPLALEALAISRLHDPALPCA